MLMVRALFMLCSLVLAFSDADSELRRGNDVVNGSSAVAEFNGSAEGRSKEDSLANMIDRALEKEFNETNEHSDESQVSGGESMPVGI